MDLVSIVIPCYNPDKYVLDAVASARGQTHPHIELVIVDDGTSTETGRALVASAAGRADRFIEQPNRGTSAARNAGFEAATGDYIVPLDCDDILDPEYVAACLQALENAPDASFFYTDYTVFGDRNHSERLPDYNLYRLLDQNTLTYAALIRKEAWRLAGGYDEAMHWGYEDWEFWLRMGEKQCFGHHVPRALWRYRMHGVSRSHGASAHHDELVEHIRSSHPELYRYEGRARIKARWSPSACVAGERPSTEPTILDWEWTKSTAPRDVLKVAKADAILFSSGVDVEKHSAECAALAAWGGHERLALSDGSVVCARKALRSPGKSGVSVAAHEQRSSAPSTWPRPLETVHRHLLNAGLLSKDAWLKHPVRSASRLIPLRVKQEINRRAGRPLFDLSFYLQFQPNALLLGNLPVAPLQYMPKLGSRRRIALITPHLGAGGAEKVFLEIASSLDRSRYEIFLLAAQSRDTRWLTEWHAHADHVYDVASLVRPELVPAALYSIVMNWAMHAVLIQNALAAYTVIPHWKRDAPGMRIMDLVHSVGGGWEVADVTAAVASGIDTRIVVSEAARKRLMALGTDPSKIRLIHNGVDLHRFEARSGFCNGSGSILFVGRLDPVKRPLLLVDIARALLSLRPKGDFRFTVAGDGPQSAILRERARRARLDHLFEFAGHVADVRPLLANSDLLVIPSENEGIPLALLEAFASGRPVVASRTGAIDEVLDEHTGVLIDREGDESQAFAAAISNLLDDPALRRRMGESARNKVETDFDGERCRESYRQLFG